MPQNELFPLNQPIVCVHNIKILKEYYTRHQHKYYKNIVQAHLTHTQTKDPRFIPSPTILPHIQISATKYNPEKDIATEENTIHIQNELTQIYENTGRYLTTIPTTRLKWLWQQYNNDKYNTHNLVPPHTIIRNKNNMAIPKIQL